MAHRATPIAGAPTLRAILSDRLDRWRRQRALRERRAHFSAMADLDPRILDDIGLTLADIEWGEALPLEVNAALEVRRRKGRQPI
ncbi:hypothetical protein [Acuticoccus sp.]|uniref:hypothetical protein n=1 Tax=Acuticoccus sp. TaxID=1904378 RepID=UPI003B52C6D9